jgi:putative transposase
LPGIKEAMPEYGEVNSQVLQDILLRVDRAFEAFLRRICNGQTPGYPRFHGCDRYHSFTYPQEGEHEGARLDKGMLMLSKIGRIAVRWIRPLEGVPKTITISREADGWYACFSGADAPIQPLPATGQGTGVDFGIEAFATLSNGARIFSPGWYRQAERALKTAQRRVSRRMKRSNRRRNAVQLLAKAHQAVKRLHGDFHHMTALAFVRTNDVIPFSVVDLRHGKADKYTSGCKCEGAGATLPAGAGPGGAQPVADRVAAGTWAAQRAGR